MRRGFTMVELIFVIVIIGILAAVAIPKLIGVQTQAQVAKITSYAGSLQRTVIPSVWAKAIATNSGSIDTAAFSTDIVNGMDYPTDFTAAPVFNGNLLTTNYTFTDGTAPTKTVASATLDGTTYSLACVDGNKTTAPRCDVYDGTLGKWLLKNSR